MTQRRVLSGWLRNADAYNPWTMTVFGREADGDPVAMTLHPAAGTDSRSGLTGEFYLGAAVANTAWTYVEVDLAQRWTAVGGQELGWIDGIVVECNNLYLDDLLLGDGLCRRSYQAVPGAAIGGVFGSQTEPNIVAENGQQVRYFYDNDLGTVMAQTKTNGTWEGVWEPDHFGDYGYRYATSPARPELGLTGQFFGNASGTYKYKYRGLDPVRGREQDSTGAAASTPASYHIFTPSLADF